MHRIPRNVSYANVVAAPAANDGPTEANMNDDGFAVVRRKRTPRPAIKVIRDSMVRNMAKTKSVPGNRYVTLNITVYLAIRLPLYSIRLE